MLKKDLIHGIIAGILSSVAAIIFYHIYAFATLVDFSKIVNEVSIISFNIGTCMLFTLLHTLISKLFRKKPELFFNLFISIGSFALIAVPVSISLPLDIKSPELFPGMTVPMLFFPVISWLTVNPLFEN